MRARIDGREGGGDVIRAELAGNVGQRPTWYVRDGERRADRERREREVGAGADERERDAMACHPAERQRRLEGGHAAARDDDLETREPGALPRTLTYAGSHGRLLHLGVPAASSGRPHKVCVHAAQVLTRADGLTVAREGGAASA